MHQKLLLTVLSMFLFTAVHAQKLSKNEKKVVKKENIFDLTFRLLLVGKSQSGKGVVGTANLLLLPEFYANDFKGENIFIFSKSLDYDTKTKILIKQKKIPNEKLYFTCHWHSDFALSVPSWNGTGKSDSQIGLR